MSRLSFRPRPLDIHKRLPIVKSVKDLDNDEAAAVVPRSILIAHNVNSTENEVVQSSYAKGKNSDIPTPQFVSVESYKKNYTCSFVQPPSYVRGRGARNETTDFVEYDLDNEDEDWLQQFDSEQKTLTADRFEWMLYRLELLDYKARERAGGIVAMFGVPVPVVLQPEFAIEALRFHVSKSATIATVYNYWKAKRERWQKPILRRLQPPPAVNDTNPFNVFRPREKAHRPHTRRIQRRENDVHSFEKLRQVHHNLEQAQLLMRVVQKREEKKRERMECEVNLQRIQLTYKHVYRMDDESLMGVYPRNKAVVRKEDSAPRTNFVVGTPDLANGHNMYARLNCEMTTPSSDGATVFSQADDSRRKRKRRRLPQLHPRPRKMVAAVESLEPVMLFTRPLDPEGLAAAGIVPPLSTRQANGLSPQPISLRGRMGRGGRLIFDRWNPLTQAAIGSSNPLFSSSRFSVPRSHPPPPRLNLDNTNSLAQNSAASDKILDSTVNENSRT